MDGRQRDSTMTHSQRSLDAERLLKAFLEVQRVRVTPDALRMWIDAFSDLSMAQLSDALRRFTKEGSEFPTPAAVRKFAGHGEAGIDDRAAVAWACVRRSVRSIGPYDSVSFDDPIINAAIRNMGGWETICEMPHDQVDWKAKEFVSTYKTIVRTGIGDGSHLHGITARVNAGLARPLQVRRITTGLALHPIAKRLSSTAESKRIETSQRRIELKGIDD